MADGPQIVPAPVVNLGHSPNFPEPFTPRQLSPARRAMAMMGPAGRNILAMRENRLERARQRQAQIRQMLLQAMQIDPSIDLSKIAPPDTDISTWQFATEIQKAAKRNPAAQAMGEVPKLLASGNPQDLSAAQQIIERAANATRDPNRPFQISPEMQQMGRNVALGQPLAQVAQRQALQKELLEREQSLPESIRVNLFARRSGAVDDKVYAENIRAIARKAGTGTTTEFERLARKSEAGKTSDLEELRLVTLATGGNSQSITIGPDGTVRIETGGGAKQFLRERMDVQESIDTVSDARQSIRSMAQIISQYPETSGFGARMLNAIQSGVGIADSIKSMTGSNVGFDLIERGRNLVVSEASSGSGFAKKDALSLGIVDKTGNIVPASLGEGGVLGSALQVSRLEAERTLLAYALAGAIRTGTGRLTVSSVEDMKKLLNFKDVRGPRAFMARLETIDRVLGRRVEKTKQRASENFGMTFPTGQLGPIESSSGAGSLSQQAPQPSTPSAPATFVIQGGRLVPKSGARRGPGKPLPPLPPPVGKLPPLPSPERR